MRKEIMSSRALDLLKKYSKMYKPPVPQIVPLNNLLIDQLLGLDTEGTDVALFFNKKKTRGWKQVYITRPFPKDIAKQSGLVEVDGVHYLVKHLPDLDPKLDNIAIVISAKTKLEGLREKEVFLRKCQRIISRIIKRLLNVVHTGKLDELNIAWRIVKVKNLLRTYKVDAALHDPILATISQDYIRYIEFSDGYLVKMDNEMHLKAMPYYYIGGIGYRFDMKIGALSENELTRELKVLVDKGISNEDIISALEWISKDIQNRVHSIFFNDLLAANFPSRITAINYLGTIVVRLAEGSDAMSGVFLIYLGPKK